MRRRKIMILAAGLVIFLAGALWLALASKGRGLMETDLDRYIPDGAVALKRVENSHGAVLLFQATNDFASAVSFLGEQFGSGGSGGMFLSSLHPPVWLPFLKAKATCGMQNGWAGGPKAQFLAENRREGLIWAHVSASDTNAAVQLVLGFQRYHRRKGEGEPAPGAAGQAGGKWFGSAALEALGYPDSQQQGGLGSATLDGVNLATTDPFSAAAGYYTNLTLRGEKTVLQTWDTPELSEILFLWTDETGFSLAKIAAAQDQTNLLLQLIAATPH